MNVALSPLVVLLAEETPEPEDVVAGWMGFAVFIGLIIAVALLGWSLTRHLRTAEKNAEHGAFAPVDSRETASADVDSGSDSGSGSGDGGSAGGGD